MWAIALLRFEPNGTDTMSDTQQRIDALVKSSDILTGQIEDFRSARLLTLGNGEDAAEGGDLVACNLAIGFGHLGPQGDDGDGESD